MSRPITRVLTAHRQREGGGFIVRRPFPTAGLDHVDPFLLIDELGPVEYAPGEAIGAPDHPHRGFETVTYLLAGSWAHEDSAGHRGDLQAGDVQWMTAGRGVVHSEMPSAELMERGGRMHGFQIWVNLPRHQKMSAPRYQDLRADAIPKVQADEGRAEGVLVAGDAFGSQAAARTHTPIVFHDWTLRPGASLVVPIPADHNAMVYLFGGEAEVAGQRVTDGQLAILGAGDGVALSVPEGAAQEARLLLLGGRPLNEPVTRYGPFVMNTPGEIKQAFLDYQSGQMGQITR